MAAKAVQKKPGRPTFAENGRTRGQRYDVYLTANLAAHAEAVALGSVPEYIRSLVMADMEVQKKKSGKQA